MAVPPAKPGAAAQQQLQLQPVPPCKSVLWFVADLPEQHKHQWNCNLAALASAHANVPSLQPVFVWLGTPWLHTQWLEAQGVIVLYDQLTFQAELDTAFALLQAAHVVRVGGGVRPCASVCRKAGGATHCSGKCRWRHAVRTFRVCIKMCALGALQTARHHTHVGAHPLHNERMPTTVHNRRCPTKGSRCGRRTRRWTCRCWRAR